MTSRCEHLIAACAVCVAAASVSPRAVPVQETHGAARIAILLVDSAESHGRYYDAFRSGMREPGYAEGRNLLYDVQWAERRPERFPELVSDVIARKPAVIVVAGQAAGVDRLDRASTRSQAHQVQAGLNMRGAKALGIAIPQSILVRAEGVLE